MKKNPEFALIHDWLNGFRGGEVVLENLLDILGSTDIYTLFYNKGSVSEKIEKNKIFTSFLNKFPFANKHYRHYLPLMPLAVESFDLKDYDIILSLNHCAAKGVIPHPNAVHICYIFTPMRYIWDQTFIYFKRLNRASPRSIFMNYCLNRLRQWDITSSSRVDHFISISKFIQRRIQLYYKRESSIIYPPCDTEYYGNIIHKKQDHYLMVSALNQYKKVDIAVRCFNNTGEKLIIVGYGPLARDLKRIANKNIEFYDKVNKETLRELYQTAKGFIQISMEDFGIAAIEAQSALTPVIAYGGGGALETVVDGKTGVFFHEQNEDSLKKALDQGNKMNILKKDFINNIENFSRNAFKKRFLSFLKGIINI